MHPTYCRFIIIINRLDSVILMSMPLDFSFGPSPLAHQAVARGLAAALAPTRRRYAKVAARVPKPERSVLVESLRYVQLQRLLLSSVCPDMTPDELSGMNKGAIVAYLTLKDPPCCTMDQLRAVVNSPAAQAKEKGALRAKKKVEKASGGGPARGRAGAKPRGSRRRLELSDVSGEDAEEEGEDGEEEEEVGAGTIPQQQRARRGTKRRNYAEDDAGMEGDSQGSP